MKHEKRHFNPKSVCSMLKHLHIVQQSIKLDRSSFQMFCLNEFKLVVRVLRLLLSFDQISGPKHLKECFPKRTFQIEAGKSKSLFLRVYCVFLTVRHVIDVVGYKSVLDFKQQRGNVL